MEKKYELIPSDREGLYRIKALKDFNDVKKGDIGGYVESKENLSHDGNCWIYGNAVVCGHAQVHDNAVVHGNAIVQGYTQVFDKSIVCGNAVVCGHAQVHGKATICGDAVISSNKDYIVFKNWWSSGRFFIWTRSNNMWYVGCFYGTGEALIAKAYKDSEESGREYKRIVKYVESILKE